MTGHIRTTSGLRRVALLVAILAVEFAVSEAGLRLQGGTEAAAGFRALFTPDPHIGHRLKPGARTRFATAEFATDIQINSAGVRDEELGPKAADERRILVLGDSLVMAVQVPLAETFCKVLERRLNDRSDATVRYRVINAGVQGYGPVESLLFYTTVAARFDPDVVLVGLYVANDAIEAADSAPRLAADRAPAAVVREDLLRQIRRVVRRSMVLQILRLRLMGLTARLGRTPVPERPLATYLEHPPDDIRDGLRVTRESIDRIAARARADGARAAVLLLPARFQIDDDDYGRLAESVRPSGGRLIRDSATARFDAALEGLAVPRLDLLPALRAAEPGPPLFFQTTAHLTPRGHEVVAGAVDRFLRDRGLLSQ